ncbi:MAG: hypothetical protein HY918_04450 [Candidatus Doudnabacteria bacterium]|nr:hypothetical protein [Candidatus Doudnabacteria bacterium]
MLDPELKNYLSGINLHLTEIKAKKSPGIWRSFFNGMFSALGYIVGLALVAVILGWFLNKLGLTAQFKQQLKDYQLFFNEAKRVMNIGGENQQSGTSSQQAGDTTIILPDGRQVKVQLAQ